MGWGGKILLAAVAIGISGCAAPPAPPPTSLAMKGREKTFFVTGMNDAIQCYSYLGLCHKDLDSALNAVTKKNDGEISTLPARKPISGSARVVIGSCANEFTPRKGYENFDKAQARYYDVMRESRLKALIASNMFDSVEVLRKDTCNPEPAGHDYVIWTDRWKWFVRVAHSAPVNIHTSDDQEMWGWIYYVREGVSDARKAAANRFNFDSEILKGNKLLFRFNGAEFMDPMQFMTSVIDEFSAQVKSISPGEKRPGGRALLILPVALASKDIPLPAPDQIAFMRLYEIVRALYERTLSLSKLEAIRQARLFDQLDVEVRDEHHPQSGNQYDWVIWQAADKYDRWVVKADMGDALPLPSRLGDGGIPEWIDRGATTMTDVKTVVGKPPNTSSF